MSGSTSAVPDCPFCERINLGDAWGTTDPRVVSFEPLNPVTPGHRLFVPITHATSAVDDPILAGWTVAAAADWAAGQVVGDCNIITSCGSAATQTVEHLHVHVVPRHAGDGLPLPWTPQQTGEGVDWRSVVDRASAVAVGAGSPDDGSTLPEQIEWLADKLHGPTLRPGGGIAGADDDGRVPILWRCRQELADESLGWRYWGDLTTVPVWVPVGGLLEIGIEHGGDHPIAKCEARWLS